jgi:hypothetical protein
VSVPELHAEAESEMFEPGVKTSLAVGLVTLTLGASTLEELEPGTTVHGVCPPVEELGLADALCDGEEELAEVDGLGLADLLGLELALALAEALGLVLGLLPAPLHAVPLRVNAVGVSIVPDRLKFAPIDVDAPVASEPFQLSLTAVTALPDWVQVADQPLCRVSVDPA